MRKSFIIAALCLIVCSNATFAEENTRQSDFIKSEEYGLISAISNAEEYMPYSENAVKRSEFVPAFVNALGQEGISGAELSFNDVAPGSDIYNLLSAAEEMSLIHDSASFRPDDAITLSEALKVCVTATGGAIAAEYAGGYPDGYVTVANSLGITKGIYANDSLSVEQAYKLIYNTFKSDYLVRDNGGYKYGEGTVMEVYHDLEVIKGIVTANEFTETGSREASENDIQQLKGKIGIDYALYDVTGDYNKYLGYSVKAYMTRDEYDEQTVVYVHPDKSNSVLEFTSNEMVYQNGYIYEETNYRKHYDLDKSAEIIYNGRVTYDYDLTSLNNICGSVTIIDNDENGEFDYILISDYYYMQVASFDKDDMVIRDKYDIKKEIVLEDGNIYSIYDDKNQQVSDLGAIEQGGLLAVKKSLDGSVCHIIIIGRILSGEVDRYSDEEVILSGEKYIPSDHFVANDMKNLRGSKAFGKDFDFYIGINDEIVAISYAEGVMQYGYIVKKYESDGELGVKIFTQNGKMERYQFEEKVILDGNAVKPEKVSAKIDKNDTKKLIRYYVNADGKIKSIDFSENKGKKYADKRDALNPNDSLTIHEFADKYVYRASVFYPHFNIQDTLIFKVPSQGNDEEAYSIGYTFPDGEVKKEMIEVYNVGMDGTAEVMVVYTNNDTSTIDRANPKIILVEKAYSEVGRDDEIMTAVIGWENGKFTKRHIRNDVVISKNGQSSSVESGDILIFSENNYGEITAVAVEFIGNLRKPNTEGTLGTFNSSSTICHYQVGNVYSLENSWALISPVLVGNVIDENNLINVKIPDSIAIYNETTKKIRTGTKDDIKTYQNSSIDASYIFVKQHYGTSNFCIVFEK